MIVDEVQTGMGRTGRMFAVEHLGLQPDILVLAKALAGGVPIGATAFGPRVAAFTPGLHGSTFGGNPLACAAGRATLHTMQTEGLPARAARLGEAFIERLRTIPSRRIREVRGLGLMIGIELREKAAPYIRALLGQGVMTLPAGPTVIRLLPPLVITEEELDQVFAALSAVLQDGKTEHVS
jgi:acetylornithine/LysW-gamma-L-lysine aminotransferase